MFRALSRHDQHHLLAVYWALGGDSGNSIAIAGLLHDIGKASYSGDTAGLTARTLNVLLKPLPRIQHLIGSKGANSIRGDLWRTRHHADLGADRLAALGWPVDVTRLIREHQLPSNEPSLLALRRADDTNH